MGLVAILLGAALFAIFAGVGMGYAKKEKRDQPVSMMSLTPSPDVQMTESFLQGVWVHSQEEYATSLSIIGDKFEWIVSLSAYSGTRFFSRGVVHTEGDVLVLETRDDMGYPFDKDKLWIDYLPISMKNLNIRYDVQKGKMAWAIPLSEASRVEGPVASIIKDSADKPIIWSKQ